MLTWLFTVTPLAYFTQSFWRDEAFTFFMAKKNLLGMLVLTAKDFNPPLYYLIMHFWIKIFGGSEIAMRSVSLIFFWATIYVAYLIMNKVFNFSFKKSTFYLVFFIINPLLLFYAFEARMYSMLAFFATLSFYALFKKKYRLYLAAAVFGLYTHYFMIFVVLMQLLFIIVHKKNFHFKIIYPILAFILLVPWMIFVLMEKNFSSMSYWISPPQLQYVLMSLGFIYTGSDINSYGNSQTINQIINNLGQFSLVLTIPLFLGIFLYFKKLHKTERMTFHVIFIWAIIIPLIVTLVSFFKPFYQSRYLIFTTVGLTLLIIYILEKTPGFYKWLFLVAIFVLTISFNHLQFPFNNKVDSRSTLTEIKSLANKNDLVYVTSELDYFTAEYYFGENRVYIYGKDYNVIPDYVGKILIPKNKIALKLPIYPTKAFVLTPDNRYTIQAMY